MAMVAHAQFLCSVHGAQVCAGCLARHCEREDECWLLNLCSRENQRHSADPSDFPGDGDQLTAEIKFSIGDQNDLNQSSQSQRVQCQLCGQRNYAQLPPPLKSTLEVDVGCNDGSYRIESDCDKMAITATNTKSTQTETVPENEQECSDGKNYRPQTKVTESQPTDDSNLSKFNTDNIKKYHLRPRAVSTMKKSKLKPLRGSDIEVVHSNERHKNLVSLLKTADTLHPAEHSSGNSQATQHSAWNSHATKHVHFLGMRNSIGTPDNNLASIQNGLQPCTLNDLDTSIQNDLKCLLLEVQAKALELEKQLSSNRRLSDGTKTCMAKYVELMTSTVDLVTNVITFQAMGPLNNNADDARHTADMEPLVLVRKNLNCLLKLELSTAESLRGLEGGAARNVESLRGLEGGAASIVEQVEQCWLPSSVFWFLCGLLVPFVSYMFVYL